MIWVSEYTSIPSGLCWLIGSSKIGIPKAWHWLGFIKVLSILFPNHKSCPNISIKTSPDSIVYEVAPVHIGIFNCSEYSSRKGATMHFSDVNNIGLMFLPKQCVSACLFISIEYEPQWIFYCFLEAFSINVLDPVLIWNTPNCRMRPYWFHSTETLFMRCFMSLIPSHKGLPTWSYVIILV